MSSGHKRTFGATVRTLNDITNSPNSNAEQPSDKAATAASAQSPISNVGPITAGKITIQHIPSLPRANDASSILQRIHSEFAQIIQKRNYKVLSITEMCCCSDGLDHTPSNRRKTKIMPNNVLGYNLTHYTRPPSHRIHLRLRHPRTHELMDYESIAGTMCHELAHCVVGPHNAKFYKVMEEIEEQYALFLARGVVLDKQGFPVGSDNAYRLGGSNVSSEEARRRAAEAAEKRQGLSSGQYVLGGGKKLRDPKEAARIAAERRLRDSQFCLPCNEVIELLGDSDDEDEKVAAAEIDGDKKKRARPLKSYSSQVIDLTEDEPSPSAVQQKMPSILPRQNRIRWACACCTLINSPAALTCEACEAPSSNTSVVASAPPSASSAASQLNATAAKCNKSDSTSNEATLDMLWSCPRCTFDNSSTALVCGACCLER